MRSSCIMGSVGSSVFGVWPILGTKIFFLWVLCQPLFTALSWRNSSQALGFILEWWCHVITVWSEKDAHPLANQNRVSKIYFRAQLFSMFSLHYMLGSTPPEPSWLRCTCGLIVSPRAPEYQRCFSLWTGLSFFSARNREKENASFFNSCHNLLWVPYGWVFTSEWIKQVVSQDKLY